MHGVADKGSHLVKLRTIGLYVGISQNHATHLRGSDIRGEINPHPLLFEPREILTQSAPVRSDLQVRIGWLICLDNGIVQRSHRSTLACNFSRNSLIDLG